MNQFENVSFFILYEKREDGRDEKLCKGGSFSLVIGPTKVSRSYEALGDPGIGTWK